MLNNLKIYFSFDLLELELLPKDWVEQIIHVAQTESYRVKLDGKSSTSREPENSSGTEVFIVEGHIVAVKLEWLRVLYETKFLEFANAISDRLYELDRDLKTAININMLKGKNARYEWHVDSNPLTGVLFVTTHNRNDGGELVFKLPHATETVFPRSGTLILFDARQIPHTVLPLQKESVRISIPLNFYNKEQEQIRPSDLNSYIYRT